MVTRGMGERKEDERKKGKEKRRENIFLEFVIRKLYCLN
jgi:hypothetical protein